MRQKRSERAIRFVSPTGRMRNIAAPADLRRALLRLSNLFLNNLIRISNVFRYINDNPRIPDNCIFVEHCNKDLPIASHTGITSALPLYGIVSIGVS